MQDDAFRWADAIVEFAADAISAIDLNGVIRSWNLAAERLYGYAAHEIIGQSRHHLLAADNLRSDVPGNPQFQTIETFRVHKSGHRIPVSLRVSPILDQNFRVIGYSEIACEIAPRLTLEGALAAIVDSSEDAIIGKSVDHGIIQSWNKGAERIYGYAAEEVLGKPMSSLLPKMLLGEEREILERVARGERIRHFDTVRVHKDGRLIHVSLTISPIRNASGEITGASHVARDITETRRLKNKFQVSQKMEALGRLAGGVAHDFNNLLTVIQGYGSMLQSVLKNNPECGDMANEVMSAAERAADLTRQLLIFSRNQGIRLQAVDLNTCVTQTMSMLRRLIGENISIETKLTPDLDKVQADPGQLSQLLMNLTTNARDAMPDGGKIVIRTENWVIGQSEFDVPLGLTAGRYVRLLFSDTGHGMDAATASQIFEPFFTTKEVGKGTGLGLATVYGIVKQSGGQILVYSEPGRGTTFSVCLPCADCPEELAKPVAVGRKEGTETILLVEDEPGIRKLASSVLNANGYKVLAAANADEALLQVKTHTGPVQLMISDIVMPGSNGQELAAQVKQLRPEIATIFMSGYTEHAVLERVLAEPDASFLQKPFTPDQLLRKIRQLLD